MVAQIHYLRVVSCTLCLCWACSSVWASWGKMKWGNKCVIALKWKALCVCGRVNIHFSSGDTQRTVVILLKPVTFHLLLLKCPFGPNKYIRLSIIISNIFMIVVAAVVAYILVIIIERNITLPSPYSTSGDVMLLTVGILSFKDWNERNSHFLFSFFVVVVLVFFTVWAFFPVTIFINCLYTCTNHVELNGSFLTMKIAVWQKFLTKSQDFSLSFQLHLMAFISGWCLFSCQVAYIHRWINTLLIHVIKE